ncbi:MAG TPA: hypothetical protein VMZ30_08020, partial [Pyrinomonadaceae bacterium]|nr:hypothetical protein [Pyrinomonadaceae bacterium]
MAITTVKELLDLQMPLKTGHKSRIFIKYFARGCLRRGPSGGVRRTLAAACGLLILATVGSVKAQAIIARISVLSTVPGRVSIDAHLASPTSALAFRNTYAGILGLGERIEAIESFGAGGERVQVQRLAPGEFRAAQKFSRVRYEVDLAQPSRPAQMSHVSWLNADHGLLMMADLLPQRMDSSGLSSVMITIDVPNGWTLASNLKAEGSQFTTDDPDTAVFLVGRSLREKRQLLGTHALSVITSGKWSLSEGDVNKTSTKILQHYSGLTGFKLRNNAVLMLIPYAGETGPEHWTAETRGNAVVLLLGKNASRKKVLSQLSLVLSHEMFHLWVPNSLNFTGDYDWFFEGFTLYQALRTDLRLGYISFDDYLNTMARVYNAYLSSPDSRLFSLIEASERRWTTHSSMVYDKGMLVAFIYDLSLAKAT